MPLSLPYSIFWGIGASGWGERGRILWEVESYGRSAEEHSLRTRFKAAKFREKIPKPSRFKDLGGGFKSFCLFTPTLGGWQNLTCAYFSTGWFNHQPRDGWRLGLFGNFGPQTYPQLYATKGDFLWKCWIETHIFSSINFTPFFGIDHQLVIESSQFNCWGSRSSTVDWCRDQQHWPGA